MARIFNSSTSARRHQTHCPSSSRIGWPGSIIEQLKIIDPLTNPTAYSASASDAFDVVIPSLLGHGFSGKPVSTGWDPQRIARAWTELMRASSPDYSPVLT